MDKLTAQCMSLLHNVEDLQRQSEEDQEAVTGMQAAATAASDRERRLLQTLRSLLPDSGITMQPASAEKLIQQLQNQWRSREETRADLHSRCQIAEREVQHMREIHRSLTAEHEDVLHQLNALQEAKAVAASDPLATPCKGSSFSVELEMPLQQVQPVVKR